MQKYEVFDLVSLLIIYFVSFLPRWKSNKRYLFLKTILYIYICFVLYFTLMPFIIPIPFINFNFSSTNNIIPFIDFLHGRGGATRELFLNILMMVPFGILVPFIYKKKFLSTIKYTAIFSLVIEFFQIFSYHGLRSFDTTDLITNTLGGIIGYFIFIVFCPLATFFLNKLFMCSENKNNSFKMASKRELLVFGIIIIQLFVRSVLIAYL